MANQRIVAIVTALLLMSTSASASTHQCASIEELQRIDAMVSKQDWAGLYSMLLERPELFQCDDPLSNELRAFVRQVSLGSIAGLAPVANVQSVSFQASPEVSLGSAEIGDIY